MSSPLKIEEFISGPTRRDLESTIEIDWRVTLSWKQYLCQELWFETIPIIIWKISGTKFDTCYEWSI